MAQYTLLDKEDVQDIAARYSIPPVLEFKILTGGSENTNYILNTKKGNYVLTICEQKTKAKTRDLAYLLEHLALHGFSTSVIIRNKKNEPVTLWRTKPVLLKEYLKGKTSQDLPPYLLERLGSEIGRLHRIPAPDYLPLTVAYGMEYFDEVSEYAANSSFMQWLQGIKNALRPYIALQLPKTLIHSDIFYSNVIVGEESREITIMDFEEATYYYRVFDLGMTLVGVCTIDEKLDLEKAGCILKGYQRENTLTRKEIESLKMFTVYAAAATAFWRHKHFNHVRPDPKLFNRYLEMQHTADYVNRLPEDCFKRMFTNRNFDAP